MLRRTLLQLAGALFVLRPVRALARILQTPPFTPQQIETLRAIGDVVLPAEIGAAGRKDAVDGFVRWCVNYRQGADMGHGYGASTIRAVSGPSPVARYAAQFTALDVAARDRGGSSFVLLAPAVRREVVEKFLNEPQPVNRLPAQPTGANLIADLMGSYFSSADALDRCYRAEIGRENCRTLDDSAQQPRAIAAGRGRG